MKEPNCVIFLVVSLNSVTCTHITTTLTKKKMRNSLDVEGKAGIFIHSQIVPIYYQLPNEVAGWKLFFFITNEH